MKRSLVVVSLGALLAASCTSASDFTELTLSSIGETPTPGYTGDSACLRGTNADTIHVDAAASTIDWSWCDPVSPMGDVLTGERKLTASELASITSAVDKLHVVAAGACVPSVTSVDLDVSHGSSVSRYTASGCVAQANAELKYVDNMDELSALLQKLSFGAN